MSSCERGKGGGGGGGFFLQTQSFLTGSVQKHLSPICTDVFATLILHLYVFLVEWKERGRRGEGFWQTRRETKEKRRKRQHINMTQFCAI